MSAPAPAPGRVELAVRAGGDGVPVLEHLEHHGPVGARMTPWGCYLVGQSAYPIGDDALEVGLHLGAGAALEVRSSGATLARRGAAGGGPSRCAVTGELGEGATLSWLVEPGIAARAAAHESTVRLTLAATARLCWREEIVLGRYGEDPPGSWTSTIALQRAGAPLLVTELALGPRAGGWPSPAITGAARVVSSLVLVEPGRRGGFAETSVIGEGATGVANVLAGPGVELLAWGEALDACRTVLAELLGRTGRPGFVPDDATG